MRYAINTTPARFKMGDRVQTTIPVWPIPGDRACTVEQAVFMSGQWHYILNDGLRTACATEGQLRRA